MKKGYADFLDFCLNGDLDKFYKNYRWKGWKKEVSVLGGDQVYNFYPFLWTREGKDIETVSRTIVPVQEQYIFNITSMEKLKQ